VKVLRLGVWAAALALITGCASSPRASEDEREHSVGASIINGYLDTATKGVVALALQGHGQVQVFCSGSLLAPNLVLTARHCIAQIGDGSSEQVECGTSQFSGEYDPSAIFVSTDAQPQTSMGQLYSVDQILEAPGSQTVCGFDVALLILSGAGIPSSEATPIVPELGAKTEINALFSAVGYGLQRADDTQGTTAGSRMRFDDAKVYCVGSSCPPNAANSADEWVGNSPVCSGDSGGPALAESGRVFGVTSRGPADCSYALYSNVADWADFIRSTAKVAAAVGGYPQPSWVDTSTGVPPMDAGTSSSEPDAGVTEPDSGVPAADAGTTSSRPPPVSVSAPTVSPLGQECSGSCPGSYQCFSPNGAPPGICVPPCTPGGAACPADYACAESLKVCVPSKDVSSKDSVSASCAVSTVRAPNRAPSWAAWFAVLGATWVARQRRRAK
jgi:Trypsin